MKSFLFFLVLSGVVFFLYVVSRKEGFQDVPPAGASPGLNIPLISPRHQTLMNGDRVQPYTEPYTTLLAPPPGQAASVNTNPPENPALQKAVSGRIQSVYETMVGFFQNDAPHLQKMGDPSIQLPLTTARGDMGRLQDEMAVLNKNPGLTSSITDEDLNGIEANVAYLQKKWRVINDLNPSFPMPPVQEEGFQSSSRGGWFSLFFGGLQEGFAAPPTSAVPSAAPTLTGTPLVTSSTVVVKLNTANVTGTPTPTFSVQCTMSPSSASSTWTTVVATNDSGSGGSGTSYTATIKDLSPNTSYDIRTLSTNTAATDGTQNVSSTPTTIKTLFGPPIINASDPPTDKTISVRFDATGMTGTPCNIYYGVSIPPNTTIAATQIGSTNLYEARITGLTPDTTYYIRGGVGSTTIQYSDVSPIQTGCPNSGSRNGSGKCSGSSTVTGSGSAKASDPITIGDIEVIIQKCNIEILRLQASGATDSVTGQMIANVQKIQQGFQQLKAEILNNDRTIDSIHMTKGDLNDILLQLGKGGSGVSHTLDSFGINNLLSSLFPTYASGDISGAAVARQIFDKYMTNMTNNLSWDVQFNYKGQAEKDVAANYASAMNDARYVVDTMGTPAASNATTSSAGSVISNAASYGGVFSSVISGLTGQTPSSVNVSSGASGSGVVTSMAPGSAATFVHGTPTANALDWKKRSTDICNSIKARGYTPYDFGCLTDPEARQHVNFSWRGYAKTVCTRLATLYDPSIPELCGCPPQSWSGWRP